MRKVNEPLVSVVITTYNRPDYLSRAINSVLEQTYSNIEIIVVDDNNHDSDSRRLTEKVMASYSFNEEIKYIKHQQNMNGAAARNTGLRNAKGYYVTYLDDDDYYLPNKITEQAHFLLNNPEYQAVYCGWKREGKEEKPNKKGNLSYEILSGEMTIRTNVIMMNRKVSLKIGGWDEGFQRNQEAVYLLRYFNQGYIIGSVPKVLVHYDTSDRSNASNPKKNEEDFLIFLAKHNDIISKLENEKPGSKSKIFLNRHRGVMNNYIMNRDLKNGLRLYLKGVKNYPLGYNGHLIKHYIQKIFN